MIAVALLASMTPIVAAQPAVEDGLQVRDVLIEGLTGASEAFVRRTIQTRAGKPFSTAQAQEDVSALLRSRRFENVFARTRVLDERVIVTFVVAEKRPVTAIDIEGNQTYDDDELLKEVTLKTGAPLDRYEVTRSVENIARKYRNQGYSSVDVQADETLLEQGAVLIRIVEGPRVRVRRIGFEGNQTFPDPQLYFKVRSKTYIWPFQVGAFDEEQAERDAFELQGFYRGEGFLDARAGYRLEYEDLERTRLNLIFVIDEGPRYAVREIRFEGAVVFDEPTLAAVLSLRSGGIAREEALNRDQRALRDKYGEIGYVDVSVAGFFDYLEEPGVVNARFSIAEGERSRFGRITVRGNSRTQDKVIRRELRFFPGEDYNTVKVAKAERRLLETSLFQKASITPATAGSLEEREALVEVEEIPTPVQVLFGVGVSTDSGLLGSVTLENRNFDLFGWPNDVRGLLESFRGAGQRLRISAEPGTEVSRFRIDFTEPYLLDRPLRFDLAAYLFQRSRESYDEQRIGLVPALGRRFESGLLENWTIEGALRLEAIDIDNVDGLAASDIRDVRGNSGLTTAKASLVRDTTDSRFRPSEGYRLALSWEQAGVLGGDYTFGKPAVGGAWYRTMSVDALERKSVLALRGDAAWLVGDAPVFERFYGGGFGSIRGFAFRGISPRKGILEDPVGGDFILLAGAEYSVPLYADLVRGVTFLDMGTVEEGFELSSWRAAVGFGLRIDAKLLVPVPIVIDFAFPIAKDDDDIDQVFNFSFGASF